MSVVLGDIVLRLYRKFFKKAKSLTFSAAAMVSLLLEELVQQSEGHVDAASLVERWIQSRDALQQFLNIGQRILMRSYRLSKVL